MRRRFDMPGVMIGMAEWSKPGRDAERRDANSETARGKDAQPAATPVGWSR